MSLSTGNKRLRHEYGENTGKSQGDNKITDSRELFLDLWEEWLEEENEGRETSGHNVQKPEQEKEISIKPETGESAVDASIPYPTDYAGHNYAVDNGKSQEVKLAAMADKPVQRTSLKEKLEAFKVKAAGTEKADTEWARGKEKTL